MELSNAIENVDEKKYNNTILWNLRNDHFLELSKTLK